MARSSGVSGLMMIPVTSAVNTLLLASVPRQSGTWQILVLVSFSAPSPGSVQIRILDALNNVLAIAPLAAPNAGTRAVAFTIGNPQPLSGNDRDSAINGTNNSNVLGLSTPLDLLNFPLQIEVAAVGPTVTSTVSAFGVSAQPIA